MTQEVELKLLLPSSAIASLREHPLLTGLSAERFELINIYCDTPQQDMTRANMALRLRNKGTQWLQTLKAKGTAQGGLHARNEWEMPVAGAALEWAALPADVLPADLDKASVTALFETRFERQQWVLQEQGSEIELVLDQGEVTAGSASQGICEIELELKAGTPAVLFAVAEKLAATLPLLPSDINKAERGYRLVNGATDWPATPEKEAPLAEWTSALCRQCEALPASRADLKHTLVGLSERGDIHAGLLHSLLTGLQTEVSHWGELPGMQRLGQWLLHHSLVIHSQSENE